MYIAGTSAVLICFIVELILDEVTTVLCHDSFT